MMLDRNLSFLCITETHVVRASSYVLGEGFLLVFSEGPVGSREYAGVGIIEVPWARRYVISCSEFFRSYNEYESVGERWPSRNCMCLCCLRRT